MKNVFFRCIAMIGCLIMGLPFTSNTQSNNPILRQYHVTVQGDATDWQTSGIEIKKGETVLFTAKGKVWYGRFLKEHDATGFTDRVLALRYNKPGLTKFRHGILLCKNTSSFFAAAEANAVTEYASDNDKQIPDAFLTLMQEPNFAGNFFTAETDQELSFIINDKKVDDNRGSFDVTVYVLPGCPDLSASYDLASMVEKQNGELDFCLKDDCASKLKQGGSFWESDYDADKGHCYLAINPLGNNKLSAAQAATFLKNNIYKIFPGGATDVQQKNNPQQTTVALGHVYELTNVKFWLSLAPPPVNALSLVPKPTVEAIKVTSYYFTFQTVGFHPLKGTAIHGIFKDRCGDLYMFQQGIGMPGEGWLLGNTNLKLAEFMWQKMAESTAKFIH